MKTLIILLFPLASYSQIDVDKRFTHIPINPCTATDSTEIKQTIFPSLGKYALLTSEG